MEPAAPPFSAEALLPTLPRCPGVYLMRGLAGEGGEAARLAEFASQFLEQGEVARPPESQAGRAMG